MKHIPEYTTMDATQLASHIKQKDFTPEEVLNTALALAETYNPKLNAITQTYAERAKQHCQDIDLDAPFAGVPFLLKDLGAMYANTPTLSGSRLFKDYVPDHNSEVVDRFIKSGLVIFGKTNSPEMGLSYVTESEFFGPCFNPWDLTRTPGGSSGGASSAVAARIIPMAHASDGGGSIRVPASCCGLFGLKPTRARVPIGPDIGEGWSGLVTTHVLSHSVRDSAKMLDLISGPECGDPYFAPAIERPYSEELSRPKKHLKIAVCENPHPFVELDADCHEAVKHSVKLCEELGHHVETARFNYNLEQISHAIGIIVGGNVLNGVQLRSKQMNHIFKPDDIEHYSYLLAKLGEQFSAADYARALMIMHNQSRKIAYFFQDYDVLITPVTAKPAVKIGELIPKIDAPSLEDYFSSSAEFAPYTVLWNITGQPAMSVPLYWNQNNLPIGTQFIGRFGDEATLFNLAAQLEQAQPWYNRRPTLLD